MNENNFMKKKCKTDKLIKDYNKLRQFGKHAAIATYN